MDDTVTEETVNVQCLDDAKKRIRSFDIRAGLNQSMWDMSFGQFAKQLVPSGLIILADAGYKLLDYVTVAYSELGD